MFISMKNSSLYSLLSLLTFAIIFSGCGPTIIESNDISKNAFITKLGKDTLAIEQFSIDENIVSAKVLLRSPRTVLREYKMALNDNGMMQSLDAIYIDPLTDSVTRTDKLFWDGDSLRFEISQGERSRTGAALAGEGILPFIDMVHWPFDLMLKRAYQKEGITQQSLISGSRLFDFELNKMGPDSMTVKHPTRGTMGTNVNNEGQLIFLEASQTTRALIVERTGSIDFDAYVSDFAERDKTGNPFGSLSGRGATDVSVLGANIKVDYGTPVKRGREIWGALVKYGKRWRTGANRATHFSTDKDLMFGDLLVPAGEYTLFTILEEDGGTLIINTQTGQNGQTYDENLDLGRVPLQFRDLDDVVEVFTITAENEGEIGMLKLQWDKKELITSFSIISSK
jgi:hypothetical protein